MKALAFVALAACTSTSQDVSSGVSIGGVPFTGKATSSSVRPERGLTNIDIVDFADACSIADESSQPSSKDLRFLLTETNGDTRSSPSGPGTYAIGFPMPPDSGPYAECGLYVYDATCQITQMIPAESGSVTLTRVDANGYTGTFDVTIDGDEITGSFDTTNCANASEDGFGVCD
ncbi:MAG: hypothetical protein QM831_11045 [Kofleriaceae bacterium]